VKNILVVAVVSAAALTLTGCTFVHSLTGGAPQSNTPAPQASADVFSLSTGECVERTATATSLKTIPSVDCSTPHDGEVMRVVSLSGDKYPGAAVVRSQAIEDCENGFAQFAGITYAKSKRLSFWWLSPSPKSWAGGDTQIVCFIEQLSKSGAAQKNTGSLKGSKQ
jgi:Septum formation